MAQQIKVKEVLPWFAAQRARFDLDQVQITQRQRAQSAEERAGDVPGGKNKGRFPWLAPRAARRTRLCSVRFEQKKAREVPPVVFNFPL